MVKEKRDKKTIFKKKPEKCTLTVKSRIMGMGFKGCRE